MALIRRHLHLLTGFALGVVFMVSIGAISRFSPRDAPEASVYLVGQDKSRLSGTLVGFGDSFIMLKGERLTHVFPMHSVYYMSVAGSMPE